MTRASDLAKTAEIIDTASYTFRNKIINGDMRIDQRNAGAAVTPASGAYTLDRWSVEMTQASKFSVQQNAGSVTPPTGFANYLGVTSLSAYSVTSTDYFILSQPIEGFNIADLAWGSASAQTITMSFWVRSSLTGTFGGSLVSNLAARNYVYSYTINAANTWEYKTITISGDTAGTWLTNNGAGVFVRFCIGAGSSVTTTSGTWSGSINRSATGQTSIVGTNGATFYITGVQFEAGSVATPFERRSFAQELLLCQRYYEKSYNLDVAVGSQSTIGAPRLRPPSADFWFYVQYKTTKRSTPTCVVYSNRVANASGYIYQVDGTGAPADRIANTSSQSHSGFQFYSVTGATANLLEWQWTADAEF